MNLTQYGTLTHEAFETVPSASVEALVRTLNIARKEGHTVFTCGNGGSAANASHLAQDLSKGTRIGSELTILRTNCLCDSVSKLTAWANDDSYEWVFFQQIVALGRPGDVLIAISGSGNSPNILHAVEAAHAKQMRTWGVTGFSGGKLINLAHRCVHVKSGNMGVVESVHGILFHYLVEAVRKGWSTEDDWLGVKV